MSCEHEVRFTIKPTDDACRFHFDVRAYKDRIVAPDEYSGATEVTPSDSEQVLPTKDKTVRANITVNPAPTESLATSENGTFLPSSGNVGFSEVVVDVEPSLESLSVTENGLYLPESGTDGFNRVNVDVPQKITFESFTLGNYPFGDVKIDPSVTDLRTKIQGQLGITSIDFQNVERTNGDTALFYGCANLRTIYAPKMEVVGNSLFQNCYALYEDGTINLAEIMPVVTTMNSWVFRGCRFAKAILPPMLYATYARTFGEVSRMHTVYFTGTPMYNTTLNALTFDTTVTDIYVPWSEGEVRNAPWGATNATIHYNTVYDEEWNVISST